MAEKPTIEKYWQVRVPSGDSASIQTNRKGELTIGSIRMKNEELDDFVVALKEAASQLLSEKGAA